MQTRNMSNVQHTVQEIHDILHSYHEIARQRVIDNVCMQAVGHYLLDGVYTPLKLFSPSFVNDLSKEHLDAIVGEGAVLT